MPLLLGLIEAIPPLDWARAAIAGWRYLCSRDYRLETHERWRHAHGFRILWDVLWGIMGVAVTLFLGGMFVTVFGGWEWLPWAKE